VRAVDSLVELAVTPLTCTTGPEIHGASLRQPLPLATVTEVRQARCDCKVILFPEHHVQFPGLLAPVAIVAPSTEGATPIGTPVALPNNPTAGIHNVELLQGTSSGDLSGGPGHLPNTPLPGPRGESVLVPEAPAGPSCDSDHHA
jgi:hypothetical protein